MKKLFTIILCVIFILTFMWTLCISSDVIHVFECENDSCEICIMIHNTYIYIKNTVTLLFLVISFLAFAILLNLLLKNEKVIHILNSPIILKVRLNE